MRLEKCLGPIKNNKIKNTTFFLLRALIVSIIGLTLHIFLTNLIDPIISKKIASTVIQKPPYRLSVTFVAYLTAFLPVVGMIIIYHFLFVKRDIIKNNSFLLKGILFSFIILLSRGQIIRQPVMNGLVGNSILVVLLMMIKIVTPILGMGILIAYLYRYTN